MDRNGWRTEEGVQLARQVFRRLVTGATFDDLSLGEHEGRIDLRGFVMPTEEDRGAMADAGMLSLEQVDLPEIAGFTLGDIDFTGAHFDGLHFLGAELRNCRFDRARFRDLRLWRTRVRDCSFRGAKLPNASLGALDQGVVNEYVAVDFTAADLRGLSCRYANFMDVNFSNAKILDIDFHASMFTRCIFAGPLDQVIFWAQPPNSERSVTNPMEDVNFAQAELRWVEFRGLRLDRVILPSGNDHIRVNHYVCVLERAVERLAGVSHYAVVFGHQLQWAHPQRTIGIWHRQELGNTEEEWEEISSLLRQIEQECAEESER